MIAWKKLQSECKHNEEPKIRFQGYFLIWQRADCMDRIRAKSPSNIKEVMQS